MTCWFWIDVFFSRKESFFEIQPRDHLTDLELKQSYEITHNEKYTFVLSVKVALWNTDVSTRFRFRTSVWNFAFFSFARLSLLASSQPQDCEPPSAHHGENDGSSRLWCVFPERTLLQVNTRLHKFRTTALEQSGTDIPPPRSLFVCGRISTPKYNAPPQLFVREQVLLGNSTR